MAKSSTFANQLLTLVFNGTAITGLAQNNASPITNLFIGLHTTDPVAGNQSTAETLYTSYARATVARTSGAWTVSNNTVVPVANIQFALGGAGTSPVANFWSIGTAATGTGEVLWSGTVTPSITTGSGITPILTTASSVVET